MPAAETQSVSLSAGFNNRVAMLALGLSALALFGLARFARGAGAGAGAVERHSLLSAHAAPADERVSRWLLWVSVLVTLLAVAVQGAILGNMPHGDGAYFADRLLRMVAGETPYSDFEFSYGPVLIYGPWALWRILHEIAGFSVFTVNYIWVALGYALGLPLTAYLLNRIQLDRVLRNGALLLIASMTLLNATLGINYSPVRFLLAYALLVWVMERLTTTRHKLVQWTVPVLAAGVAAAVTPEMGVALLVACGVALVVLTVRERATYQGALLALVVETAALGGVLLLARSGTIGAFAGGAFHLPVLPGPSAVFFVGSVLLAAWGVGSALEFSDTRDTALQWGWLVLVALLVVPAFGRADFVHIFWNGLGVMLVGIAVSHLRWRLGGVYLAAAASVFIVAMVAFGHTYTARPLTTAVKRVVYSSEQRAVSVSRLRGKSPKAGTRLWKAFEREKKVHHRAALRLSKLPNLAFAALMWGETGLQLAESGNLIPLYGYPGNALTGADFRAAVSQLEKADNLVIPVSEYVWYQKAAKNAAMAAMKKPAETKVGSDGVVVTVPDVASDAAGNGLLQGVAVVIPGRNASFDPAASFGIVMGRDWVAYDTVGPYTWLIKRSKPAPFGPGLEYFWRQESANGSSATR